MNILKFLSAAILFGALTFTACKSEPKVEAAANETTPTAQSTNAQEPQNLADPNAATQATSTTTNVNGQNVTVNTATPTTSVAGTPAGTAAATPTGPTTTITYEETTYDFGKTIDGSKVKYSYKFKNTGKEPLIISDAKGSCGCTVPVWPKDPIGPGKTGEIKVEFDSKGKLGPQTKKVTVVANTQPAQTFLTIKGEVTPAK